MPTYSRICHRTGREGRHQYPRPLVGACGYAFRFVLRCPPDFPSQPPLVKLLTTDDERLSESRFSNGEVD
ncbi:hypothetical protein MRX96_009002 [Rhipicephalus microplus]